MSQTPLVTGMILGGVVISALGAASSQFVENKNPTMKTISRDFIIGGVMVLMIMQLLPESSTTIIEFLLTLVPLTLFTASKPEVEEVVKIVEDKILPRSSKNRKRKICRKSSRRNQAIQHTQCWKWGICERRYKLW